MNKERIAYGDWQTPYALARSICTRLKAQGLAPTTIVEPTCGVGHFIRAALDVFDTVKTVYAIELYAPYIQYLQSLEAEYPAVTFRIHCMSVFDFDFSTIADDRELLVIGNPPWVTNSLLGSIGSKNLPTKSNFKHNRGLDAMTGMGNFDISESILLLLFKGLAGRRCRFALLVKNAVIRNIVREQAASRLLISDLAQYEIDTRREFGAAAAASLFVGQLRDKERRDCARCKVYDFYSGRYLRTFGIINDRTISNIAAYQQSAFIDGRSPFTWRSGIKHDCARIMELSKTQRGSYLNGLKAEVAIEDELIYPLVKSSDIASFNGRTRKHLLVTQRRTSDDTSSLQRDYPLAYRYLSAYGAYLDGRKSSIYLHRPRFCLFGIGDYSFMPYKVAISSLYRTTRFTLLYPIDGKPVVIDDTCYAIGFNNELFARITLMILNSAYVQDFIRAVSSEDAKRIITKELLMRIDLRKSIDHFSNEELGITEELRTEYLSQMKQTQPPLSSLFRS